MKKIMLFAFAALALTSCKQGGTASDGYTFEQGSKRLAERQIKVVTHPSFAALKEQYAKTPGARVLNTGEDLQAFSQIGSTTCTIHMIDPAVHYQPEFFGHELVHCLYGEFHPSQNNR